MTGLPADATTKQAAAIDLIPAAQVRIEGISTQYLASLRHKGGGPVYVKLGRKVYYRQCDIDAWVASNLHTRTDKPVGA